MKNLVIVESPAKARTIGNFLGKDYEVIASKGHIRDLPKSSFGIKIEDGVFIPQYKIPKESSATAKELKEKAKKAEQIFLATDEDREGEAIAYHIAKAIKKEGLPRIVFHEITKKAIQKAIKSPRTLDTNSVNAQQARRLLDRIVGYRLSPLLAQKIQRGLSAGRVQSAALKIVVDKEREIKAFVPLKYFSIDMVFKSDLKATLVEFASQKIEKLTLTDEKQAKLAFKSIQESSFKVSEITFKERLASPPAPFMTSSLQQNASSMLGFSPKKTMMLAQKLYEGVKTHKGVMGVITYMRTDSLSLAAEAVNAARDFIEQNYGKKYVPKDPVVYKSKSKSAQEAHEAIRPTSLDFTLDLAKSYLTGDEFKLYSLIYKRFLACQMSKAKTQHQNIFINGGKAIFKLSGKKIMFDGYQRVLKENNEDVILPSLEVGQDMSVQLLELSTHHTEPPARYSEASLIKKLESLGIGRPSTYAPTISLLSARDYVVLEKRQLIPQEIAFSVIELLEKHFSQIVDTDFSSKLEKKLDEIAENKLDWQKLLNDFYHPFMEKIEKGKSEIKSQKVVIKLEEKCPECGGELAIRKGRFGEFVACLAFPKCKFSRNLNNEGSTPKKTVVGTGIKCPECKEGEIVERMSRRGKFYGCSLFPKCKFTSSYRLSPELCPECGQNMVIKELKRGTFLECRKCKIKKEI